VKKSTSSSALLVLLTAAICLGQATRPAWQVDLDKMANVCKLSDEQIKKIKDIEEARAKALAEVDPAFAANALAVHEAAKGNDVELRKKLAQEHTKITQQVREMNKKYDDARSAVLSDEQKGKLADAKDAQQTQYMTKIYTEYFEGTAKECGVSDDHVKSIVAIYIAANKAMEQWRVENAAAFDAWTDAYMQAAYEGDEARMLALLREREKLAAPIMELSDKAQQDSMAVLPPEQRAKVIEHFVLEMFFQSVQMHELTDDQKAKVKDALKPLAAEKDAMVQTTLDKLVEKLFGDILTKEQKAKWLKRSAIRKVEENFTPAKLTDDQKSRIKGDYDTLAADEKTAPDVSSAKDLAGMYKLLSDTVKKLRPQTQARLTDEQKKAMEKAPKSDDEPELRWAGAPKWTW